MKIPRKADPNNPGKIFLFAWDERTPFTWGNPVLEISRHFTLTDLSTDEGYYEERPSVLVLLDERTTPQKALEELELREGGYGKGSLLHQYPTLTEENFLQKVKFSDEYGINVYTDLHPVIEDRHNKRYSNVPSVGKTQGYINNALRQAKKYFDIVIITGGYGGGYYRWDYSGAFPYLTQYASYDKVFDIYTKSTNMKEKITSEDEVPIFLSPDPRTLSRRLNETQPGLFLTPYRSLDTEKNSLGKILEQRVARYLLSFQKSPKYRYPRLNKSEMMSYFPFVNKGATGLKIAYLLNMCKPPTREMKSYEDRVKQSILSEGETHYEVNRKELLAPSQSKRVIHPYSKESELFDNHKHSPSPVVVDNKGLSSRYELLEGKWTEYELNPIQLLKYPLMSDMLCEETVNFHYAYQSLIGIKKRYDEGSASAGDFHEALKLAEMNFLKAEGNAKRSKHSSLTNEQRGRIWTARNLVTIALNEGSSPNERIIAWRKANDKLEGIIHLPDTAIKGLLEAGAGVEIETETETAAAAAAAVKAG